MSLGNCHKHWWGCQIFAYGNHFENRILTCLEFFFCTTAFLTFTVFCQHNFRVSHLSLFSWCRSNLRLFCVPGLKPCYLISVLIYEEKFWTAETSERANLHFETWNWSTFALLLQAASLQHPRSCKLVKSFGFFLPVLSHRSGLKLQGEKSWETKVTDLLEHFALYWAVPVAVVVI